MNKTLTYLFLFCFVVLTAFLIISATSSLDMSSWSFLGSDMAKLFVPYVGYIYLLTAIGVLMYHGWKR